MLPHWGSVEFKREIHIVLTEQRSAYSESPQILAGIIIQLAEDWL